MLLQVPEVEGEWGSGMMCWVVEGSKTEPQSRLSSEESGNTASGLPGGTGGGLSGWKSLLRLRLCGSFRNSEVFRFLLGRTMSSSSQSSPTKSSASNNADCLGSDVKDEWP